MPDPIEIEVEIDAEGNVHVEVKGAKGKACLEYLEIVRRALGEVRSQSLTSEFYETAGTHVDAGVESRTRRS